MKLVPTSVLFLAMVSLHSSGALGAPPEKKGPTEGNTELQMSSQEQKTLELTNQAREKEKLRPLKPNPRLFQAARNHSANMARQGKMEHVLDGKTPVQRVEATGYRWRRAGENIAYGLNTPIEGIFKSWMESQHHRENILRPEFREIGIGVASNSRGEVYYTQVFGTPRSRR